MSSRSSTLAPEPRNVIHRLAQKLEDMAGDEMSWQMQQLGFTRGAGGPSEDLLSEGSWQGGRPR